MSLSDDQRDKKLDVLLRAVRELRETLKVFVNRFEEEMHKQREGSHSCTKCGHSWPCPDSMAFDVLASTQQFDTEANEFK